MLTGAVVACDRRTVNDTRFDAPAAGGSAALPPETPATGTIGGSADQKTSRGASGVVAPSIQMAVVPCATSISPTYPPGDPTIRLSSAARSRLTRCQAVEVTE